MVHSSGCADAGGDHPGLQILNEAPVFQRDRQGRVRILFHFQSHFLLGIDELPSTQLLCTVPIWLQAKTSQPESRSISHPPLCTLSAGPGLGILVFAFRLDPLQQLRGGFVVGVLRDEFPAEGLGKDGLGQLVHVGLGFLVALLDVVGDLEEGFDASEKEISYKLVKLVC